MPMSVAAKLHRHHERRRLGVRRRCDALPRPPLIAGDHGRRGQRGAGRVPSMVDPGGPDLLLRLLVLVGIWLSLVAAGARRPDGGGGLWPELGAPLGLGALVLLAEGEGLGEAFAHLFALLVRYNTFLKSRGTNSMRLHDDRSLLGRFHQNGLEVGLP